jgi:phage baseplate assembly protein W
MSTSTDVLGRDLAVLYRVTDGRHEDVDLRTRGREVRGEHLDDLSRIDGMDNAVQAVVHRIKTQKGELAPLGHASYGSRHHELIGEPNSEHNRNLVKLYILQALAEEPRIAKIAKAEVRSDRTRAPDRVEIELTVSFIGAQVPTNLVIPFSFQGLR